MCNIYWHEIIKEEYKILITMNVNCKTVKTSFNIKNIIRLLVTLCQLDKLHKSLKKRDSLDSFSFLKVNWNLTLVSFQKLFSQQLLKSNSKFQEQWKNIWKKITYSKKILIELWMVNYVYDKKQA